MKSYYFCVCGLVAAVLLCPSPGLCGKDIDYEAIRLERRLHAVKITEKITIDGRLDEAAWDSAVRATAFTQREPEEGEPASEKTEVAVLYDAENLYLGVVATDSQAGHVIISELKKDFSVDTGDSFQIILDTFHDQRNAYHFIINPAGAKWDAQIANEGREVNQSWDGVWYVKSRIGDTGWTAEIAIPFKTLKFPHASTQTWGINFQRTIRRRNEDSLWAPVPRIYTVQRVSSAGTLEGLEGIEPGSNLKIKPYILGSFAQNLLARSHKYNDDAGVDVKYGITSGLTWDFTYNTDFSQVEADEQQINLSRYSLLFPEKRDFFLENSGIFLFGVPNAALGVQGGTTTSIFTLLNPRPNAIRNDLTQFFSRTIGLSDSGDAIPILGGTRLTGSAGRYQVGVLEIQQRESGPTHATNFFVGRVRRNILANSDIGVMVTNKEVNNSSLYNRSAGADANFRFGQSVTLNGFLAKTMTPNLSGKDRAGRIAAQYQDKTWQFASTYTVIEQNYHNEMGFIPRVGIRRFAGIASYTWRPQRWHKVIRDIRPHWQPDYVADSSTGHLETKFNDFHLPLDFQNGAQIEMGRNPTVDSLSQPFTISGTAVTPREYKFNDYFILGNTDMSRRLSANGRLSAGRFYSGYKHSYLGGGAFRVNYKLTTSIQYTYNNINLAEGRVKQKLLVARLNYGFTTTMFLDTLIQYNSDNHQWSTNVRFNIIHHPLSDLFVVYNEHRDPNNGGLVDRALIAKVTYMISR
jgi:hypothetical protein